MKGLSKKQLLEENHELREENARLRQEIELLRQKMDLLIRRVFGRSSEKLDASQLDLFLMAPENESGKVDASSLEEADPRHEARARRGARCRERWPADLPVVEEIIDPKEIQSENKAAAVSGGTLRVNRLEGFAPKVGTSWEIITGTAPATGRGFASVVDAAGKDYAYTVAPVGNNWVLTVTAVP